ncbi:MAG: AAA family ATPase [Deltaproteobacteria bacterium]|nr:AAA family ATPase [Deltaproteobacteria bacterium]
MTPREKLLAVRAELRSAFVERDEAIDGLILALLSRQHVLLLGPPGTAKSMLARELVRRLDGKRGFEWLLTKFTTPEELFGPVSLPALEEGRYERVTFGKLPEAEIVFLDEVWKASSAILNALLTVMNERRFHQGTKVLDVPLLTLVAASNEIPEEDELGALYDRFLLRFTVGYVERDHRFLRMLTLSESGEPGARLSAGELSSLFRDVERVPVPDNVLTDLLEVRKELTKEGVVASDRRYRLSLQVLKAAAVLEGRERAAAGDLRWLEHVLWTDPEDRPKVSAALAKIATGFEEDLKKLLEQAREVEAYARRTWPDGQSKSRAVLEAHTKLKDLERRARQVEESAKERGRHTSRLAEMATELSDLSRSLLKAQN